jgi:RimJ/RimL family protein N-acetyltransferase
MAPPPRPTHGPGPEGPRITTARLVLRPFTDVDRVPFFELNTHPLVVESLGTAPTREESDAMIERSLDEMARESWGFWAVEVTGGAPFVGMVGLHRIPPRIPCAPAVEVGWRLHPDHWRRGYATEAATASLSAGFERSGAEEIVAYTATLNTRSQAVMARLAMVRDPADDFDHPHVPEDSPLRRHVLSRISASQWSQHVSTVAT